MNVLKSKYRFAAIVLLTAILSHITLFHFSLEQKVLCEDEGEQFHIENAANAHIAANNLLDFARFENTIQGFGTDYKLDIHIDQNIVRSNNILSVKFHKSLKLDFDKNKELAKFNIYENKNFFAVNTVRKSLSTITLII